MLMFVCFEFWWVSVHMTREEAVSSGIFTLVRTLDIPQLHLRNQPWNPMICAIGRAWVGHGNWKFSRALRYLKVIKNKVWRSIRGEQGMGWLDPYLLIYMFFFKRPANMSATGQDRPQVIHFFDMTIKYETVIFSTVTAALRPVECASNLPEEYLGRCLVPCRRTRWTKPPLTSSCCRPCNWLTWD